MYSLTAMAWMQQATRLMILQLCTCRYCCSPPAVLQIACCSLEFTCVHPCGCLMLAIYRAIFACMRPIWLGQPPASGIILVASEPASITLFWSALSICSVVDGVPGDPVMMVMIMLWYHGPENSSLNSFYYDLVLNLLWNSLQALDCSLGSNTGMHPPRY